MKEGASNCVERHLTIATLPFYGHILKWGMSVVFIANALHRAPYARVYTALARGDSKLRFTITAMEQEREGEIESGKPRRHIGLQKDLGYSRRSCEVRPCLAPPENDGATWPFPTSDATWEPQACVQHFLYFFWLVAIRLVACTQLSFCSGVLRKRGKCCVAGPRYSAWL